MCVLAQAESTSKRSSDLCIVNKDPGDERWDRERQGEHCCQGNSEVFLKREEFNLVFFKS